MFFCYMLTHRITSLHSTTHYTVCYSFLHNVLKTLVIFYVPMCQKWNAPSPYLIQTSIYMMLCFVLNKKRRLWNITNDPSILGIKLGKNHLKNFSICRWYNSLLIRHPLNRKSLLSFNTILGALRPQHKPTKNKNNDKIINFNIIFS